MPGVEGTGRGCSRPGRCSASRTVVAVVGSSLGDHDEALNGLAKLLAIGGPVALLLASLAGYWMAGAALRPVDTMRRRAAEISASEPGARLPVPEAERRAAPPRRDAERDARAARGGARARAPVRRRRQPRAAHASRAAQDRARARAPARARRGRAARRDRLGDRRDRPADRARRAAAGGRAQRGRRAGPRSRAVRDRRRARRRSAPGSRPAPAGPAARCAARCRRRRRCSRPTARGSSRRSPTWSTTRSSTARATITLQARPSNGPVELHVTDEGPGIPDDFIERAFERFSRPDGARGEGGTGLGLAVVDSIARAHGGLRPRPQPPGRWRGRLDRAAARLARA